MRYFAVALLSFILSAAVISNAYYQKKQFYPTVVYLTSKPPCFSCMVIFFFVMKLLTFVFFGRLLRSEVDNLVSQSWYAFFDMCLVFALFQDELGIEFFFLASIFLFVKAFHWLLEERVDYMERTPALNILFHLRIINLYFVRTVTWKPARPGFSVHLALGVEYLILTLNLFSTKVRYVLHSIDAMREHTWDKKTTYLLYLDILVGFLRLIMYVDFAFLMWPNHPFPLFIARPIYLSVRMLKKSIRDVIMSRRAIRYMNTVFGNATAEDLSGSSDSVCIICREEMVLPTDGSVQNQNTAIKRLPCSHLFHVSCLRSWFQRQQTCPTCRMDVIRQARQEERSRMQPRRSGVSSSSIRTTTTTTTSISTSVQLNSPNTSSVTSSNNMPWMPPNMFSMYPPYWSSMSFNANTTTTNSPSSQIPQMFPSMPILMPPFMGMPIVYPGNLFGAPNLQMPEPPSSSPELIDAERLQASAEARFTALRQINVLLNAAVLQMNAYVLSATDGSANVDNGNQKTQSVLSSTTLTTTTTVSSTENNDLMGSKVDSGVGAANDLEATSKSCSMTSETDDSELAKIRKHRLENLCGNLNNNNNGQLSSVSTTKTDD